MILFAIDICDTKCFFTLRIETDIHAGSNFVSNCARLAPFEIKNGKRQSTSTTSTALEYNLTMSGSGFAGLLATSPSFNSNKLPCNHSLGNRRRPNMNLCRYAIFSFLLIMTQLSSCVNAVILSSPEPEMDPFGAPKLFVISAGRDLIRSRIGARLLYNGARICPSNYPAGLSIRCAPSGSGRAKFFVNGSLKKTEIRPPFYIRGDYGNLVVAWSDYPSHASLKCKMDIGSETTVSVSFGC